MKKLRIAVLGVGHIGSQHARHANAIGDLAAVCDIKHDRADTIAAAYNCRAYYSLEDMLAEEKTLDLISICTPNGLHAHHTIAALKAGCNVLCEKPMATTVHDCERMIHTAEETNRRLFIVKQNRFNPPVAALKQAIDAGKLGKIINIQVNCFWNRNQDYYRESDWRGKLALDGGTLFTQYSHFIDLIYWLIGDVEDVKVYTQNYLHHDTVEFEDTGVAILSFSSGAIGAINFTIDSYGKNMEGSLTLFGEKGTVKIGGQYPQHPRVPKYRGLYDPQPPPRKPAEHLRQSPRIDVQSRQSLPKHRRCPCPRRPNHHRHARRPQDRSNH